LSIVGEDLEASRPIAPIQDAPICSLHFFNDFLDEYSSSQYILGLLVFLGILAAVIILGWCVNTVEPHSFELIVFGDNQSSKRLVAYMR